MRTAIAQVAPLLGATGAALSFFAGNAMAADLGEMFVGQVAAIVIVLVVDINHMHKFAAGKIAVRAAMGMPEKVLKRIGQVLRAAAQ